MAHNWLEKLDHPQNIVMYMHALAIHKEYDFKKVWIPLMKKLLCSNYEQFHKQESYQRTLTIVLDLLEVDNSDEFKKN